MDHTIPQDISYSQTPLHGNVFIYALCHPETKEIRYIGKTKQSIRKRLTGHLNEKGDTRKVRWIATLKEQGLTPEVLILEEVDETQWEEQEVYWIACYRELGCDLTNLTDGGDGVHNPGEEARRRLSATRKQMYADPEFRAKMMEVIQDPERRTKISQSHTGKTHTPEHVAKLPQNQPGRKLGEKQRQNVRNGLLKRIADDKANGVVRRRTTPITEEEHRRRSLASTGKKQPNRRKWTEEEKLKRSLTQKGRPLTQTHSKAIAEGQKQRWERQRQANDGSMLAHGKAVSEGKQRQRERKRLEEAKNNGITFLELWTQESNNAAD